MQGIPSPMNGQLEYSIRSSPTIIPKLFSNGVEIEFDEAHEGDNLTLDLSHSYDDLDDINHLDWSIWVNGVSQNELHSSALKCKLDRSRVYTHSDAKSRVPRSNR